MEFAAKGFDGASTRSIAERVDAYQPQINYHFESKESLWTAAVDHLFDLLRQSVGDLAPPAAVVDPDQLGQATADALRRFVRFAAAHPELNRIMMHEATDNTERLRWMVDRHVRPLYEAIRAIWEVLIDAGIATKIDPTMVHYVIVGSASLPFVNAPEAQLLTGLDPTDPSWVESHADGIIATLLPGLVKDGESTPLRRKAAST